METLKENKNKRTFLKERMCLCGCEELFIPGRRDQYHVNGLHTDNAYNHGKRKSKTAQQIKAEKQLVKNDKILDKFYKQFTQTEAIVFSLNLKADGFDPTCFIGNTSVEGEQYFKSYNYLFREYEHEGHKLTKITIQKRKIYAKR